MKRIFLFGYERFALEQKSELSVQFHLCRRMTPLQKSCLEAISRFEKRFRKPTAQFFADDLAPIIFTTAYGELVASLNIAQSIYQGEKRVSPLAFQHSVHNVAAGYIAIWKKVSNPIITLSTGFLSLDKALYLGYEKIYHGLCRRALIVHSQELATGASEVIARTQVLGLTGEGESCESGLLYELTQFHHSGEKWDFLPSKDSSSVGFRVQEQSSDNCDGFFELPGERASFCRQVTALDGETLFSEWRAL